MKIAIATLVFFAVICAADLLVWITVAGRFFVP